MAKRFYQVGEPCDACGTPTIASKNPKPGGSAAYCWPCWSKWKDSQKAPQQQNTPQGHPTPAPPPITPPAPISALSGILQKISDSLLDIKTDIRYLKEEAIKRETGEDYVPLTEDAKKNRNFNRRHTF